MVLVDSSSAVAAAATAHDEALAHLAAGRTGPARDAAAHALDLLAAARGPADPDVANVALTASQIEQAAGDLPAARAHVAAAVTAAGTWDLTDPDLANLRFTAELALANLDQSAGDLDAAEHRLRSALDAALDAALDTALHTAPTATAAPTAAPTAARTVARTAPELERSVLLLTNALGVTYKFAGRLDDAQRCYDQAYDLIQSAATPNPADLAGLFHNLAGLAHSRGQATDGILWAQRGIAIRAAQGEGGGLGSALDNGLDLARDYGGLGALQHLAGDHAAARASYAQAEAGTVAALGPDHLEVGVLLANRAVLEADAGDPAAARDLYHRALTLMTAALGPEHAEVRHVQANLALLPIAT